MGHPAICTAMTHMVRRKHRSPDRPVHHLDLIRLAGHFDGLVMSIEVAPPAGRAISVCVVRIAFEQDDVAPVRVSVRETPRDMSVAADDHRRHARKGHADQRLFAGLL